MHGEPGGFGNIPSCARTEARTGEIDAMQKATVALMEPFARAQKHMFAPDSIAALCLLVSVLCVPRSQLHSEGSSCCGKLFRALLFDRVKYVHRNCISICVCISISVQTFKTACASLSKWFEALQSACAMA